MSQSTQFCTFYLGSMLFGIGVDHVQEIIRYQAVTEVPMADDAVKGLINLRGQIVMAIDLHERLRLEGVERSAQPMNVVVRTPDGLFSLLVDRIGDVMSLDEGDYEAAPETLDPATRALIRGAYKLKERLLLALDLDEVLNARHRRAEAAA